MKSRYFRLRPSFSLAEVLMVLAVMAVLARFAIPIYRNYQIRNDLNLAEQQTIQILHTAQVRAQSGLYDSAWGIYVPDGILFQGTSYAGRNPDFDEIYPLAPTISVLGLTETSFSQLYGEPNQTGIIVLKAVNGETREIPVTGEGVLSGPPTIDLMGNVRMKITFEKIQNQGDGSAEAATYVGPEGIRYEDGAWIPLKTGSSRLTDDGLIIGATGLAVERRNGVVRVLAEGSLSSGGKEVVDARITFENATIERVENDETGEHATENPFDGNVNNGVGGDEVTLLSDGKSVLFQTRVTNYGDSILIYWKEIPPWWMRLK